MSPRGTLTGRQACAHPCTHPCTHRRPHCCILWVPEPQHLLSNSPETDLTPLHLPPPPPEILHPQVSHNSGPSPGGLCSAPAQTKPLGSQRAKPTMSSLYYVGAPEVHRAVTRSEEGQGVRSQEGDMLPRHYRVTTAAPFHRRGSRGTERASGLAKMHSQYRSQLCSNCFSLNQVT